MYCLSLWNRPIYPKRMSGTFSFSKNEAVISQDKCGIMTGDRKDMSPHSFSRCSSGTVTACDLTPSQVNTHCTQPPSPRRSPATATDLGGGERLQGGVCVQKQIVLAVVTANWFACLVWRRVFCFCVGCPSWHNCCIYGGSGTSARKDPQGRILGVTRLGTQDRAP